MISLCITTYNRSDMLIQSFRQVIDDDRIGEIIIVDDASGKDTYEKIESLTSGMPKVKLFRNDENLGMSRNKKKAVEKATHKWNCLFDSDNVLTPAYLDAFDAVGNYDPEIIYVPDFAYPQFNYTNYSGLLFNRTNVADKMSDPFFRCLLNTCNWMCNRARYLALFRYDPSIKGTDTIQYVYNWLMAGYSFYVVPGMQYYHRVHDGSGWLQDADYNMKKGEYYHDLIKKLS